MVASWQETEGQELAILQEGLRILARIIAREMTSETPLLSDNLDTPEQILLGNSETPEIKVQGLQGIQPHETAS